jgi:hypothetical protein
MFFTWCRWPVAITAILLSGLQYFPLLMLIHTPAGYVHLTAETLSAVVDPRTQAVEAET